MDGAPVMRTTILMLVPSPGSCAVDVVNSSPYAVTPGDAVACTSSPMIGDGGEHPSAPCLPTSDRPHAGSTPPTAPPIGCGHDSRRTSHHARRLGIRAGSSRVGDSG